MPAATLPVRASSTSSTPEAPLSSQNQRFIASSPLPGPMSLMTASSFGETFAFDRRSRSSDIQCGPIQPVSRPNSSNGVNLSAWVMPTPWLDLSSKQEGVPAELQSEVLPLVYELFIHS